jgi:UDP-glucose 4-epimerase
MKSVLVTGGGGFVGANLVRLLLKENTAVTVLDDFSAGSHQFLSGLNVDVVEGSVLDCELVNAVVRRSNGVVHLAAQTGVPGSLLQPRRDCEINVIGTLNVLEACRRAEYAKDRRRIVFASSNAPLGRQTPPATEDKAALPVSPYGASKLAGEAYCLAYQASFGLATTVLRFGNVYGPFSMHKTSVVAKFLEDLCTRGRITVDGDGSQTRDFIYVEDVCRAIHSALCSQADGEIFQIATGVETSISRLANLIENTVGHKVKADYKPARHGDVLRNFSVIEKAHRVLSWQPRTGLDAGLRETWQWYQDNRSRYQRQGAMSA